MRSIRVAGMFTVVLMAAVLAYGQRGGHGGGGAAMGGPPAGAGPGATMGHSGNGPAADHGSQSGSGQSQARTPEQLLNQNTKLTANLQKLLPAGTTPQAACENFRNLGQCVAAIHVSHNLGIPFTDLKSKITGSNAEGLGQAIEDLKPGVNASEEKKRAQKQAHDDLNEAGS